MVLGLVSTSDYSGATWWIRTKQTGTRSSKVTIDKMRSLLTVGYTYNEEMEIGRVIFLVLDVGMTLHVQHF